MTRKFLTAFLSTSFRFGDNLTVLGHSLLSAKIFEVKALDRQTLIILSSATVIKTSGFLGLNATLLTVSSCGNLAKPIP